MANSRGKPSTERVDLEAKRLALLHDEQKRIRGRLTKSVRVKKYGAHLPGEERYKKQMAVIWKVGVPGIGYDEIAARLGEPEPTVRRWFNSDVVVKEFYDWVLNNLKGATLSLLQTYALEAVETLALLMRFGQEKYMFEAAKEILSMAGPPKTTRQEIETESTKKHEWSDRDKMVEEIRKLPPEEQERAVAAMEKFEELLAANSPDGSKNGSGSLSSIVRQDDDDQDEEP